MKAGCASPRRLANAAVARAIAAAAVPPPPCPRPRARPRPAPPRRRARDRPAARPDAAALRRAEARFAPVDLRVDLSRLPPSERAALAKLVEAARVMDALFLRQVWAGNEALLLALARDETPLGRARLQAFLRYKGPWSRLDGDRAFIPGVPPKPPEANFYPAAAEKADVERWLAKLSPAEQSAREGLLHGDPARARRRLRRRARTRSSTRASSRAPPALLREAAAATREPSLRRFLEGRAEAFLSNDYYASDVAWMELDAAVEPTIGPYEVYEDEWFNAKAAFEAFVNVRDDAETAKLPRFAAELQGIEDALPIDAAHEEPEARRARADPGGEPALRGRRRRRGRADRRVQPAERRARPEEKGSKRVMLKNVQEAKFEKVLVPIARDRALHGRPRRRSRSSRSSRTSSCTSSSTGSGPTSSTLAGRRTTVRAELGDAYSALEEAKADVGGLFALQKLIDEGKIDRALERTLYPTFLASAFRSLRFGLGEAHGKGMALQLNWLLDAGAVTVRRDGTFAIDAAKTQGGGGGAHPRAHDDPGRGATAPRRVRSSTGSG